jgi:hypothetical protein
MKRKAHPRTKRTTSKSVLRLPGACKSRSLEQPYHNPIESQARFGTIPVNEARRWRVDIPFARPGWHGRKIGVAHREGVCKSLGLDKLATHDLRQTDCRQFAEYPVD